MTGNGRTTLAARVAAVQTRVTVITLALVTLVTAVAVSFTLSHKTDQQLDAVLGRVTPYLAERPTPPMDWKWLNAEIQEVRPSNVRIEVRDAAGDEDPDIAGIVPGPQPNPWGDDRDLDADDAEAEGDSAKD